MQHACKPSNDCRSGLGIMHIVAANVQVMLVTLHELQGHLPCQQQHTCRRGAWHCKLAVLSPCEPSEVSSGMTENSCCQDMGHRCHDMTQRLCSVQYEIFQRPHPKFEKAVSMSDSINEIPLFCKIEVATPSGESALADCCNINPALQDSTLLHSVY